MTDVVASGYLDAVTTSVSQLESPTDAVPEQVAMFEEAMQSNGKSDGFEHKIIEQISDMKDKINNAKDNLNVQLDNAVDDPAKLLQVQWSLQKITMQEELIAKTAGKTSQNVETLLKAQ